MTALTATLIAGVIAIVAILVIRLSAAPPPLTLPPEVSVPAGETAQAVTLGRGWVAVVTRDAAGQERVRILDATTGAPRGVAEIDAAN